MPCIPDHSADADRSNFYIGTAETNSKQDTVSVSYAWWMLCAP